jgi:hypothetical protein
MSDGLIPMSEHSNQTSIMMHMSYENDVHDDNYLYQMLIDYNCMLSISCKHYDSNHFEHG